MQDLEIESLVSALFSNPKNPYQHSPEMYRPVPCLSFALNWYFGRDDPFGYHLVNICLHLLTGYFLFLFIQGLFASPALSRASTNDKWFVPIIAAGLWAINPIHTQAVTYIVQRMAVLAGLFYLLGLYSFLKARLSTNTHTRLVGWGGCFLCYILALGSKENAIILPLSLILIEFAFFREIAAKKTRFAWTKVLALLGLALLFLGMYIYLRGDISAVFKGYNARPFSMFERLLTEARILVLYLSQIFYPHPARLSIDHDIVISTSFMAPWTTTPALLFLFALSVTGAVTLRKYPLIGFSILFFILNHVIESSVIPLELLFEHRNYLPSFFLFVPVALGLKTLLDRLCHASNRTRYVIYLFTGLLFVSYAAGTFVRNRVWATEKSLWEDAAIKAPNSARPLTNLAWDMAYGENAHPDNYDNALKLYAKALKLNQVRNKMNASVLNNMAVLYYKKKEYERAVGLLQEALNQNPTSRKPRFDLASVYITLGRWEVAETTMTPLLTHRKVHEGYLNQQALILLHQNRAREARPILNKSLQMAPAFWKTLTYLGLTYRDLGEHEKADTYLRHGWLVSNKHPLPLFCLIDNALAAGNRKNVQDYIARLLHTYPEEKIQSFLNRLRHDNHLPPISYAAVSAAIKEHSVQASK